MSEYQYYEFKVVDRTLTKAEMGSLRDISTRAVITSTSFSNHYEWGGLKADPLELLADFFDAFVYVSNSGIREFHLRLPLEHVDSDQVEAMLPGRSVHAYASGQSLIVSFEGELEFEDWDDGDSWMDALISLRADLLSSDLRSLYLGWLYCLQNDEFRDEELEPPVPAGLFDLSESLNSLIIYLGIDRDLIDVAAVASTSNRAGPSREELAAWIGGLPEKDKDDLLLSAVLEPGEQCKRRLLQRFQLSISGPTILSSLARRSAKQLLTAAHVLSESRKRREEEERAAEIERRRVKAEADRIEYLKQLAKRQGAVWNQVEEEIQKRHTKGYDSAVRLLLDLRDVAASQGTDREFQDKLEQLYTAHVAKGNFIRKVEQAGL